MDDNKSNKDLSNEIFVTGLAFFVVTCIMLFFIFMELNKSINKLDEKIDDKFGNYTIKYPYY